MVAGVDTGITAGGHVGLIAMTALRYAQESGRSLVMPVRPSDLLYANFRHIQVQPETRLDHGVPLYKLKILDTLIEHLSRDRPSEAPNTSTIDALIGEASRGLRSPYRAGFLPAPGAFVDLLA